MKNLFVLVLFIITIFGCRTASKTETEIVLNESNPVLFLSRSACYGYCPSYNLTFLGNGSALYVGLSNVDKKGTYEAKISKEQIHSLIAQFEKIKFFELKDMYDDMITDVPTYTVRYTLNRRTKEVSDRFGSPQELRDLERFMDTVADSLDWKKISEPAKE